jgi:hypothetical protein
MKRFVWAITLLSHFRDRSGLGGACAGAIAL